MSRVKLIGYWSSKHEPEWPDPVDFIDSSWDPAERELVANYLDTGSRPPWVYCGFSRCRICSRPNGTSERTDGVYLWPDGLSHYIREHAVRLPLEIVEHIRQLQQLPDDADNLSHESVDRTWWTSACRDWSVPS